MAGDYRDFDEIRRWAAGSRPRLTVPASVVHSSAEDRRS